MLIDADKLIQSMTNIPENDETIQLARDILDSVLVSMLTSYEDLVFGDKYYDISHEYRWYGFFLSELTRKPSYDVPTCGVSTSEQGFILFYNPKYVIAAFNEDPQIMFTILLHEIDHIVRQHIFIPDIIKNEIDNQPVREQEILLRIYNLACDIIINHELGIEVTSRNGSMSIVGPNMVIKYGGKSVTIDASQTNVEIFLELLQKSSSLMNKSNIRFILSDIIIDNTVSYNIAKATLVNIIKNANRLAGTSPGHLSDYIEEILHPKVSFATILRRLVGKWYGKRKRTWFKPNRRYQNFDFIVKGINKHGNNKVVFCVDTSGSITREEMQQELAELDACVNFVDITVVGFDSEVHTTMQYKKGQWKQIKYTKGGTSFINLFKYLENNSLLEYPVIIATDGVSSFPKNIDKQDVWWVMINNQNKAPFGHTINISV